MKSKVIKFIVLWNWDLIINRGDDRPRSSTGGDWRTGQGRRLSDLSPDQLALCSVVVNDARPTVFFMTAFTLRELLISKGIAHICWFLLLNTISGPKGSGRSQLHPVKCWYQAVNYFAFIWDFPSDLLQQGMCTDRLLLRIYCHGQGGKDFLVIWKCALRTRDSLGVPNCRNLV